MRILVVEDEAKSAAYVRKGLTEQGYAVDVAHATRRSSRCAFPGPRARTPENRVAGAMRSERQRWPKWHRKSGLPSLAPVEAGPTAPRKSHDRDPV